MKRSEALDSLRAIHDLDVDLGLPEALWILVLVAMLTLVLYLMWRLFWQQQHWRQDARALLHNLQKRLMRESARSILDQYSILLRRIAMARKGREACAGLTGDAWLQWLQNEDPNGFAWLEYRDYLTELCYAPPSMEIDVQVMKRLLEAAKQWTYKE